MKPQHLVIGDKAKLATLRHTNFQLEDELFWDSVREVFYLLLSQSTGYWIANHAHKFLFQQTGLNIAEITHVLSQKKWQLKRVNDLRILQRQCSSLPLSRLTLTGQASCFALMQKMKTIEELVKSMPVLPFEVVSQFKAMFTLQLTQGNLRIAALYFAHRIIWQKIHSLFKKEAPNPYDLSRQVLTKMFCLPINPERTADFYHRSLRGQLKELHTYRAALNQRIHQMHVAKHVFFFIAVLYCLIQFCIGEELPAALTIFLLNSIFPTTLSIINEIYQSHREKWLRKNGRKICQQFNQMFSGCAIKARWSFYQLLELKEKHFFYINFSAEEKAEIADKKLKQILRDCLEQNGIDCLVTTHTEIVLAEDVSIEPNKIAKINSMFKERLTKEKEIRKFMQQCKDLLKPIKNLIFEEWIAEEQIFFSFYEAWQAAVIYQKLGGEKITSLTLHNNWLSLKFVRPLPESLVKGLQATLNDYRKQQSAPSFRNFTKPTHFKSRKKSPGLSPAPTADYKETVRQNEEKNLSIEKILKEKLHFSEVVSVSNVPNLYAGSCLEEKKDFKSTDEYAAFSRRLQRSQCIFGSSEQKQGIVPIRNETVVSVDKTFFNATDKIKFKGRTTGDLRIYGKRVPCLVAGKPVTVIVFSSIEDRAHKASGQFRTR